MLRPGEAPTSEQIIAHVRTQIAHYKAPDQVEFVESLPKTATGKIRKVELRDAEWVVTPAGFRGEGQALARPVCRDPAG